MDYLYTKKPKESAELIYLYIHTYTDRNTSKLLWAGKRTLVAFTIKMYNASLFSLIFTVFSDSCNKV